ncbi:MAG TPA: hypothetical protein VM734_01890 [Kofleriaceae bacterium]|nr:hypothetical protein [Kofleriaceae bacterium]
MTDLPPFPDSMCHRCRHLRLNGNKRGSVFLACSEPSQPRYRPQPVRLCAAFSPASPE